MRLLILAAVLLIVVSELGQTVHGGRSRSRGRGKQIHPLYKRVLRRGINLSRRDSQTTGRVKRDECSDQCGKYFQDTSFQECSDGAGSILGDDPDTAASAGGGATICGTDNCGDIFYNAFKCIGDYCSGGSDPSTFRPVLNAVTGMCLHKDSDQSKYCYDAYITFERDATSDRNQVKTNFQACSASRSCNSDECLATFKYLEDTLGCCYSYIPEMTSSFMEGLLDLNFLKSCTNSDSKIIGVTKDCAS